MFESEKAQIVLDPVLLALSSVWQNITLNTDINRTFYPSKPEHGLQCRF